PIWAQDFTIFYESIPDDVNDVDSLKLYLFNNTTSPISLEAANISVAFDPTLSDVNTTAAPAVDNLNDAYNSFYFVGGPYQSEVNTNFMPSEYDGVTYTNRYQYANTFFPFLPGASAFTIPANASLNHALTIVFPRKTAGTAGQFYVEDADEYAGVNMQANGNPFFPYNATPLLPTTFPVELLDFTAYQTGEATVQLDWATAQEENSAVFQIERSVDGAVFTNIGEVAAAGNSQVTLDYTFLDFPVPTATLLYRLRQVDIDGSFTYSDKVEVVISNGFQASLDLFHNPTTDLLNVRALVAPERKFDLYVLDVQGKILIQQNTIDFVNTSIEVDVSQLAVGQYMIQLVEDGTDEIFAERFTIVR
ncbi:MAG: T9SS type A sorting domain-containing protein, partial [Bacteroidota bacterium]